MDFSLRILTWDMSRAAFILFSILINRWGVAVWRTKLSKVEGRGCNFRILLPGIFLTNTKEYHYVRNFNHVEKHGLVRKVQREKED